MRCLYVSYDGALDPLGSTQVLPYLEGLVGRGVAVRLLTFEKTKRWEDVAERVSMEDRIRSSGITWIPRVYHQRPRLPAKIYDVVAGARAISLEGHDFRPDIVHCRGDVAMAMGRLARLPRTSKLLYDVRALFSAERVEFGSWPRGGLLDRVVQRVERANLARADGIVVLTEAGRNALASIRPCLPPHRVIPTCVDDLRFRPRPPAEEPSHGLVFSGSLGGSYLTDEMVTFARLASPIIQGRCLFLTPQSDVARSAGATPDWADVQGVPPSEVPAWLRRARALFFFRRPSPANLASFPTKIAEALATGLPVICNRGGCEVEAGLESEGVAIVVRAFTATEYRSVAERARRLLEDPGLPGRCREVAIRRYALDAGVNSYHHLYRELGARP